MADIRNLPVPDPAAPVVPELPVERVQRLEAEVEDLRAENQRLRALLNDLPRLTQRVLALRAGRIRGPLLGIALGMAAAYILAILTPFDEQLAGLIKRVVAGDQTAQAQSHRPTPSAYPLPSSPTAGALDPSPAVAVPSPRTSPSPPAAAPPIVIKLSPIPSPSLPVPLPSPTLPIHPCSVTNGKPPQCQPTPLTP